MDGDRVQLTSVSGMYGASRTGLRPEDQDWIAGENIQLRDGREVTLGILCDGMGGGVLGEIASMRAAHAFIEHIMGELVSLKRRALAKEETRHIIWREAIQRAHQAVVDLAEKEGSGKRAGSTMTAIILGPRKRSKKRDAWVDLVHIGDCRCYLLQPKKPPYLITRDHSLTGDMVESGYIKLHDIPTTPGNNKLTQSLGMEEDPNPPNPMVASLGDLTNTRLLLCCDGVWGPLHRESGLLVPNSQLSLQEQVNQMVDAALEAGSKDNCSALIIDII